MPIWFADRDDDGGDIKASAATCSGGAVDGAWRDAIERSGAVNIRLRKRVLDWGLQQVAGCKSRCGARAWRRRLAPEKSVILEAKLQIKER